jgi:hypothetical protein
LAGFWETNSGRRFFDSGQMRSETPKLETLSKASFMSWCAVDKSIDLKTAQQAIAANWIEVYKTYVSPNPPSSRLASSSASEPAAEF